MTEELTAETITILIGVVTLIIGVINSIITNRQSIKTQHLEVILTLSEAFREKWESNWSDVLDELGVDHLSPRTEKVSEQHEKVVRHMLNWIDWLGALKSSGAMEELNVLTSSIGVPIRRIMNAGYTTLEKDCQVYGADYWSNLFVVAEHMSAAQTLQLKIKYS